MAENLHVTEAFTLHRIVKAEGRDRPMIEQTAYDRGEVVTETDEIEKIKKARDEGEIGHNVFVQIKVADAADVAPDKAEEAVTPEGQEIAEPPKSATPATDAEGN